MVTLDIALKGRIPIRDPSGAPITEWRKDERNRRVGDAPLPLHPKHLLRVGEEGVVNLTTA